MKFIVEGTRRINMAQEWKETEIKRNDITNLLENTKKLAVMYSELLKTKREGWEKVLNTQMKKDEQMKKEHSGS